MWFTELFGPFRRLLGYQVAVSMAARSFVQETIEKNPVVIFSKSYCPFCKMAKEVFVNIKAPFLTVELDDRPDADDIQEVLREMTGAATVPRVFVGKQCIGGGTDVKKMHQDKALEPLLKKAGVLK
uniref:Putative glutaredoxin n=2 Tax=Ixodes ricinus TaxID=34613 RepID=A0A0K8RI96_IXORI